MKNYFRVINRKSGVVLPDSDGKKEKSGSKEKNPGKKVFGRSGGGGANRTF
ncbi:hypothetical protein FACS1894172_07470 [Spirochaetia bacterium]|nr:hypothetical protein FACS1894164_02200 [Spirochaetia bacterium]GHU31859.1 hypothetical protein FACS1894172_07470 [Spirochaetia bacterium]